MSKTSYIAELSRTIINFKPLVSEKLGTFTGEFQVIDKSKDKTKNELLALIGMAVQELCDYMHQTEKMKEQYFILVNVTSDAHALLTMLGIRDKNLFDSIQILHDKYRQLLDVMIKLSSHNGTGEQLRQIAEQSLIFFGPASMLASETGSSEGSGDVKP